MDGVYVSKIKTPMGEIQGKLTLRTQGNSLSGVIEALGMKSEFQDGMVKGNQCQFSGTIKTMMGNIEYQAAGVVNGKQMKVTAKTNMGNFEFVGERS